MGNVDAYIPLYHQRQGFKHFIEKRMTHTLKIIPYQCEQIKPSKELVFRNVRIVDLGTIKTIEVFMIQREDYITAIWACTGEGMV